MIPCTTPVNQTLTTVYQLQATGTDWLTESTQRTICNIIVYVSHELAASRVDDFRQACIDCHKLMAEGITVDIKILKVDYGEDK